MPNPIGRQFRLLGSALLLLLAGIAGGADPIAGNLLEVSRDATLQPQEIGKTIAALFEGYKAPQARYAVDIYLITYASTYTDGSPARINAQLFIPRIAKGQSAPLYLFAPGTTGLVSRCRPSREHILGIRWGLYRSHVLAFAGQGIIGLLPDYMGFGDQDRLQPYYHAVSEGRMMLDGVRAVFSYGERQEAAVAPPQGVFLAGFCQGAHAAFAAADLRNEYAPELTINGIIGYGATTNLEALFREFPVVAPMVVYTFSKMYGVQSFDPAKILADRWLATLASDVTRQCVGAMQSYYPWTARDLFRPQFLEALRERRLAEAYPEAHAIMAQNSTGLSGHRIPALILQGTDDVVVLPSSQEEFVADLRRSGSDVQYKVYKGSRHDTRQIAFYDVLQWMRAAP